MNVFYSWQSDFDPKSNRYFIEDCVKRAIKKANKNLDLSIKIDRDTNGEIGSPDIADVIFKKIEKSSLFIADVSITHFTSDSKPYPNSNVLIELGYAAAKLGWDNIICIYNTACEVGIEKLPFDIRSRRILTYSLKVGEEKSEVRRGLVNTLEKIIAIYDFKKLSKVKKIKSRYSNEDVDFLSIAIEEADYWEFELFAKLLENRLTKSDEVHNRLKKGLYVYEKINISNQDFFDKTISFNTNNIHMLSILDKIINNEIYKCLGETGESGNQIEIIDLVDNLSEVLHQVIKTEINILKFNITNPTLIRLRDCLEGMYENFSKPLWQIIDQFEKVYAGEFEDNGIVNISLKFKAPERYDQIAFILDEIRANPYILKEE